MKNADAPAVKREAHRPHTEALGSSAEMRCVSCWYRQSRATAKSTSRTPRTIQILMRIRAALPPVRTHARRGSRKRPDRRGLEPAAGTCHGATGVKRHDQDNPSRDRDAQIGPSKK